MSLFEFMVSGFLLGYCTGNLTGLFIAYRFFPSAQSFRDALTHGLQIGGLCFACSLMVGLMGLVIGTGVGLIWSTP